MRRAKEFGVIDVNPLEGAVKLKREDSKGKPRLSVTTTKKRASWRRWRPERPV